MPFQSKYAGECYKVYGGCGAKWNEGDMIDKNGLKNTKGKDAYCIHGENCKNQPRDGSYTTEAVNQTNLAQAVMSTSSAPSDGEKIEFARKALTAFIAELAGNQIEPEGCRDSFGAVFNTALMNKK